MIVTIILLSLTTIVLGYTTWNLLRKNEAQEDVVDEQMYEIISQLEEYYGPQEEK